MAEMMSRKTRITDAILAHPENGHEHAFQVMKQIAGDPSNGALMVRICCAVSEANGDKSLSDQIEIVSLCTRLGIEPRDCGLYTDQPLEKLIPDTLNDE